MHDLQILLSVIFIPLGISLMTFAALWQLYIMFTETYTLDRYQDDKRLVWVVAALFFSFSLAVYYFCPNARKKGRWFWLAGISGIVMYGLAQAWLPPAQAPSKVQAEYAVAMLDQACLQTHGDAAAVKSWAESHGGTALNAAQRSLWSEKTSEAWQWDVLKNRYVLVVNEDECSVFARKADTAAMLAALTKQTGLNAPTAEETLPNQLTERRYTLTRGTQTQQLRLVTTAAEQTQFQAALSIDFQPNDASSDQSD